MARTASNMLSLGTQAPSFSLPNTIDGKTYHWKQLKGQKGTVVLFICNHCPFVIHLHKGIRRSAEKYREIGINFVAISSNDISRYPQDAPDKMRDLALEQQFSFPYLYDATQEVAKAFDAACTPDFYFFDSSDKLVYRGQFDDSRPENGKPVTGADLHKAIEALLANQPISKVQHPSIGCNIKWREN